MEQALIRATNLVQAYDGQAVVDVRELSVNKGDVLAIIGRNGSGKSTLLRILGLLERPVSGEVLYHGRPLASEAERHAQRQRMAMVFQEPLLFSGTVRFNVTYGLSIRGVAPSLAGERCDRMLDLLGIGRLAERNVDTLSGGEAQRASLARALAVEPEILFLDEPMANLDSPTRSSFRRDLARVLEELRCSAVYVTHDASEAMSLCNRIAVMSMGRIVQDASPREVWDHPATEDTARLVGIETFVDGIVEGCEDGITRIRCAGRTILSTDSAETGAAVVVSVRPEHVRLCVPGDGGGLQRDNVMSGIVAGVEPLGAVNRVIVDCGFTVVALTPGGPVESAGIRQGSEVEAVFSPAHAHLIRTGDRGL